MGNTKTDWARYTLPGSNQYAVRTMNETPRLFVCGGFFVSSSRGGEAVTRLRTRKTEQLCAFLALERDHWQRRESLLDLFWPADDPAVGRRKLRLALHSIRQVLGDSLQTSGDKVCLSGLWVDALDDDPAQLRDFDLLLGEHEGALAGHQSRLESDWRRVLTTRLKAAEDPAEKTALALKLRELSPHSTEALSGLQGALELSENRAALRAFQGGAGQASQGLLSGLALHLLGGNEPVSAALVGPPGVGKTYLARQLLALATEEEIVPLFVSMLGVRNLVEMEEKVTKALLASSGRVGDLEVLDLTSTLLVIDNADDLPTEAEEFFARLTPPGSPIRLLVTLPEARFAGIKVFRHKPLSLPKEATAEALAESESGQFLALKAGISLAQSDPKICARLCFASGGLPLVLQHSAKDFIYLSSEELEAGEIRQSSASEAITARLTQGFARLTEAQKCVLLNLSLLGPQFHPRLTEALGIDPGSTLDLWERSWIQHTSDGKSYEFLPSVYAFLLKQKSDGAVLPADYGHRLADLSSRLLSSSYLLLSEVFTPTLPLLRQALNEAIESEPTLITRLWSAMYFCLLKQSDLDEAVKIGAEIYGLEPNERWLDGRGINFFGSAAFHQQNFVLADRIFRFMAESDEPAVKDLGLCNAGLVAMSEHKWDEATILLKAALDQPELKPRQLMARWNNLAHAQAGAGDYQSAEASAMASLAVEEEEGGASHEEFRALACVTLAAVHFLTGRQESAREWAMRAQAAWGEEGLLIRRLEAVMLRMTIESRSDSAAAFSILMAAFPRSTKGPLSAASHWAPAAAGLLCSNGLAAEGRRILKGLPWPKSLFWLSSLIGPEPEDWGAEPGLPFSDRERWFLFIDALKRL